MEKEEYQLIDSGRGIKLEQFGPYLIQRPAAQAFWNPKLSLDLWNQAHALFTREQDKKWTLKQHLPERWSIVVAGIRFKIQLTDFGHLGIFPEQSFQWRWIEKTISNQQRKIKVLNLFAHSGGATLAAAKAGAVEVVHLDASKGMNDWARENAALNSLTEAPIRWIVDDVKKFLQKELRRGNRYDAIILDPPSFGRGTKGEVFKIEEDVVSLLQSCRQLLSENPLFILFSCHSAGFTPIAMHNLLLQVMDGMKASIEVGEMVLKGKESSFDLPSGTYARWCYER